MLTLLLAIYGAPALANPYGNPYAEPVAPVVNSQDPFSWEAQVEASAGARRVVLTVRVPAGHVVYQDQVEVKVVSAGGMTVGDASLPPAVEKPDPAGAETRAQYDRDVIIYLPITAGGPGTLTLEARHQGCRPGLCFPPKVQTLTVDVAAAP